MQQEEKKILNFVSWRNAGILQPIRDQRPETRRYLFMQTILILIYKVIKHLIICI
ncbi:hypothetical protein MtrunA17_Chr5g0441321 [Medicago truncatula]|uniref:Transmembrane protein n=1 Tax=Medicago truncatula TaxID=3880 RepID=A0A396I1E8_MEDTR|nr:hypothetical protein MtrunA17_Chr5g0441321 [Medicago truncatula]